VINMMARRLICALAIAVILLPLCSGSFLVKAQVTPSIHFETANNIFTTTSASVGTKFNVSVLVADAPDLGGANIHMEFNDSMINVTRWFEPTGNSSYLFFGMPSAALPGPPNPGYLHLGPNRARVEVAVSKGGNPPTAPWGHSGLASIFEINITAVPTNAGDKFTSALTMNTGDTFLLDPTATPIDATVVDGYFEISKPGGPPPPSGFTLTITSSSGGSTNPAPGDHSYSQGSTAPVQAIPNTGYSFDHWDLDNANVGSANPYSVTMDSNHTLKAVFNQSFTLTIVVTTGGSTNPSAGDHQYASGFIVSVQANPDVGHHLDHWELDSVNVGLVNPYSVTMDSNHTLNAFFLINNYTLTITASSGGTTDPVPGIYSYTYGTSVSVNATADAKYIFDHWELDAAKVGSTNPYLVTMNDNHTLKAVFVLVGEGLKGDVNGDGKVDVKDLFSAVIAFGSYGPDALYPGSPSHLRWDARCDLNKDGKVNLIDFFIICINFGKTNA
jgi:hypothetical protein